MGSGVAQTLAASGFDTVLVDLTDERLESARARIRQSLRMQSLLGKRDGARPSDHSKLIRYTIDYDEVADADFVIENVPEKPDVKRDVYRQIDSLCSERCIFAANTSAVSITRIGGFTGRPGRVLGMHFMNPVPLKPVVEMVRGYHTTEETVAAAHQLLEGMGKEGILVEDFPGFVSNRVLMLMINEAIWLVQDKVAPVEDVDQIFTSCFGHKMGPLETGDLIGLDTILNTLEVLHESYEDPKFRPCPLLRKLVDAGRHGRKSGRGLYDYEDSMI